jgi:hypothetical protein
MAVAKIKEGRHSLGAFLAELKQARLTAKLGELTPEELRKVKEAWEQGLKLVSSAQEPVEIVSDAGRLIGRYSNGSHLEIIQKGKPSLHGGNMIHLHPEATTRGEFVLDGGDKVKSIFGREVDYLTSKGYTFLPDGTAVKAK